MFAELISIGDELLIGQVVNTNASWLAAQLNDIGVDVRQITCVSDKADEIFRAMEEAEKRADVILMTGGLGPTKDDITKDVLCRYFNTSLEVNTKVLKNVELFFEKKGVVINELNKQQALVPVGSIVVDNPVGTAPGIAFERNKKFFIAMPGVPYEMKSIMESYVLPKLLSLIKDNFIVHRTVLTQGIGESFLANIIAEWENNLPDFIKLAYLPSPGLVRLRLSAKGTEKQKLISALSKEVDKLIQLIPGYFWGFDNEKLEAVIGKLLQKDNKTIVTAESCTGGYIAHRITGIAGSSSYFKGSVIAYDNNVKEKILEVDNETLRQYGAVSQQVVEQMAKGAQKVLQADYAIATTGIAGPDGGTDEKPVGTVWIAIATPFGVKSKKFQFGDSRERNIIRSAMAAFGMLRYLIMKKGTGN